MALNKFTDIALPFHLNLIDNHRNNIVQLQQNGGGLEKLRAEVEAASRAVRQLGSLLFEMEVLKSYLETGADILYFDLRVEPAKKTAYHAIQELHEICPNSSTNYSGISAGSSKRSSSLTICAKTPDSPQDFPNSRRHSDSETQSVSSHTYSLNGDSRESLLSHRSRSIQVYQGVLTQE
ncbi:uncharacterized protein LOC111716265 [Eurytemora carolleeae]|uniref:uncharacterized protein LOC111716265 n=1 Tax=Eurytemora carolleeae TaxID=1294199 RepID=UPI000C7579BF|nr:uncharacterized protein LOC111716265 [Eurytemora carolleeae]|eukprot:XP_023347470.1 uncharacterized protein LOC111716265 [Eurytemora affinis]